MPDSGEDESELGALVPKQRERLEEPLVVLVWPRPRGVEKERLARRFGVGAEALGVDAQVHRMNALRSDAESLDHAFLHPIADHHHLVGSPGRPVVGEPAEEPLAAREQLREVQVLRVEQRQHGRTAGGRHGNGERVVDDVGLFETAPERTRTQPGRRHRPQPAGDGRRSPVPRRHRRPQAAARVGCKRRDEGLVVVPPDPGQRSRELARVGLAATRDPGDEGEQAERDARHVRGSSLRPCRRRSPRSQPTTSRAHFECEATSGTARNAEHRRAGSRAGAEAAQGQPGGDCHAEQSRRPRRGRSTARPHGRARAAPARRRRRPTHRNNATSASARVRRRSCGRGMVHAASTRAPRIAASSTGATAAKPLPPPASVTTVCVKSEARQRSSHRPTPRPGSAIGSASVAPTIATTDGAASAAVVSGARPQRGGDAEREERQDGDEEPRAGPHPPKGRKYALL